MVFVRRSILIALLITFGAVVCRPGQAQPAGGDVASAQDTSTTGETESASWLFLPYASYAPDTKFAGGLTFGYYRPEQPDGSASNVQTTLTVTQRRQLIAGVETELYLADGRWRGEGQIKASHFPNSFYGIGGDTPASAEEAYTERYALLDLTAQRRVRPNLRIGPRVFVRGETVRDPEAGGLIDRRRVDGAEGGVTAGLGLSAFWDGRNSLYYPTTGSYAEVVFTLHSAAWGSDYTFGRVKADLRGYRSVGPGTLAGQVYAESVMGTTPFQQLPLLGGSSHMRGYRDGRFRDDVYWTVQSEYRFPLFWRFKGVVFASVGEVGPRIGGDLVEDVETAIGIGGRLRLTEDGVHGRLDIAYSPTGIEPYVSMGEAF